MQREIAELLEQIARPGSFAVSRSAPADALRIEVQGVGALDLPLSPRTVSKLRAQHCNWSPSTPTAAMRCVR